MESLLLRSKDYFLTRKSLRTKTPLRIIIEKRKQKLEKIRNGHQHKHYNILKNSKLRDEIKKFSQSKQPIETLPKEEREKLI